MSAPPDFASLEVIPNLPDWKGKGEPFPSDLVGAVIVSIGTPQNNDPFEGGGLIIDYRPSNTDVVRRMVFEFNEQGMWVEYNH